MDMGMWHDGPLRLGLPASNTEARTPNEADIIRDLRKNVGFGPTPGQASTAEETSLEKP